MPIIVAQSRGAVALDTTAPVITNVVAAPGYVSWSASEPSTGQVEYGPTVAYGSTSTLEPRYLTYHYQEIPDLYAGYHYRILAYDEATNQATLVDRTIAAAERPWAAPVTTATYTVPGTIDATGTTDVQAALNAWVASVPDASVIQFSSSAHYRLTKGILVQSRANLVFEGNGATFHMAVASGNDEAGSCFVIRNSDHIAINNFTLIHNNPNTTTLSGNGENAHILGISGWYAVGASSYIEMGGVTGSHSFGDGVYIEGKNSATTLYAPTTFVWIHDCDFDYIGRMGIAVVNGEDVLVERCSFDHVAYHVLDIEPNFAWEVADGVTFRDNTAGIFSLSTSYYGLFVSDAPWEGVASTVNNITVTNNTVAGNPSCGYDGRAFGINAKFLGISAQHHTNITFTGNVTAQPVYNDAAIIYLNYVDTAVITGNIQPLGSGSTLVGAYNSTGITSTPNP